MTSVPSATSPRVHTKPVFPVLDTLRVVGAVAVLTTHTTFQSGDYLGHGVWGTLLSRLDVGVAIFFVLSGFLLSRPFLARAAAGQPRPSTRHYYRKRFFRIFPVYVVAVVAALTLLDQDGRQTALDWARSLLLLDVYTEPRLPQGLTQMWSLAAEVAFYAVLPLLMALGVGRSLRTARVVALLLALVAVSVSWHLGVGNAVDEAVPGMASTWLPGYLGWFAVGIALALAHVEHERSGESTWWVRQLRLLGSLPGTCWALAGGLMLLAATPLAGPTLLFVATPGQSLFKHLVYALVAALLVVTGVFDRADQPYTRVMSAPGLRHLGHISYSTFCIHLVVLHGVMAAGDFELFAGHGWQIWALTLLFSLAASEVLYRLVELPALRLRGSPLAWRVPSESTPDQPRGSRQAASTR